MSVNILTENKNKRINKMVEIILKNPNLTINEVAELLSVTKVTVKNYLNDLYIKENYDVTICDTMKNYLYREVEKEKLIALKKKLIIKKQEINDVVITFLNSKTKTLFEVGVVLNMSSSKVGNLIHDDLVEEIFSKKIKKEVENYLLFKDRDTNGMFARKTNNSLRYYTNKKKRKRTNSKDADKYHYTQRILSDIADSNNIDYGQLIDLYNTNKDFSKLINERINIDNKINSTIKKEVKNGKTK